MKTAILDQLTLASDGTISIQWLKQIIDPDTGEVVHSEPLRRVVDFDGDVDTELAVVFDYLDAQKVKLTTAQRNKMKSLVGKIDGIAKADADIAARRQAKIAAKQSIIDGS